MPEDHEARQNGLYEREFIRSINRRFDQARDQLNDWRIVHLKMHDADRVELPNIIEHAMADFFERVAASRQEARQKWHETLWGRVGIAAAILYGGAQLILGAVVAIHAIH